MMHDKHYILREKQHKTAGAKETSSPAHIDPDS